MLQKEQPAKPKGLATAFQPEGSTMKKRACKYGRRKDGKCRKTPKRGSAKRGITTASGRCRFGKVKVGKRKGKCLKNKRCKRK
jgi:hypothetical protein